MTDLLRKVWNWLAHREWAGHLEDGPPITNEAERREAVLERYRFGPDDFN